MANKTKNLQWGSANRPKVSNKLGAPDPREGGDGDIQIRQSVLGAKLFGRIGSDWYETPLGINGKTKFGTSISNYLSIDHNSVDIFANNTKVASFGATTTVGNLNSSAGGDITVDNITINGRITLDSDTGNLGDGNIIIGSEAMASPSNTDNECEENTAIGYQALQDLTGGNFLSGDNSSFNVAIGSGAAKDLSTGSNNNIAIGTNAMRDTTTSTGNTVVGVFALGEAATSSQYNTAIGFNAGKNINGDYNTCLGYKAGDAITSGDDNICIGRDSDVSSGAAGTDNQIAIGKTAVTTGEYGIAIGNNISAATNDAVMGKNGNTITCDFDADGTWTQSSDIRKKTNIQDDTLGLAFINDLKTKTFQWKPANEHPEEWGNFSVDEDENKIYADINTDIVMHGLIAQEVKESLDKINCSTFGGWKLRADGQQELAKASFVIPLIKAVQELSAQVDAMQIEINNLK